MVKRAIILAAGCGSRLSATETSPPKCLLEFGGETLLARQIEALQSVGVRETVLVIGYSPTLIHTSLPQGEMLYQFVRNDEFASTNTLRSLSLAARFLDEDFYLLNADVLFDHRCLERLKQVPDSSALACDYHLCGEEEVKARVAEGYVVDLGKNLPLDDSLAEFVGLGLFRGQSREQFVQALCLHNRDSFLSNEYFEFSLASVLASSQFVAVDVSDLPTIEIDFPEDLLRARDEVFPQILR